MRSSLNALLFKVCVHFHYIHIFLTRSEGSAKGTAFFTHNGTRLDQTLDGVDPELYPVVHMQKKEIRVRANFGQADFVYREHLRPVPESHQLPIIGR